MVIFKNNKPWRTKGKKLEEGVDELRSKTDETIPSCGCSSVLCGGSV
jgi:hypothetical protein